jgi:hypothetical protein
MGRLTEQNGAIRQALNIETDVGRRGTLVVDVEHGCNVGNEATKHLVILGAEQKIINVHDEHGDEAVLIEEEVETRFVSGSLESETK